MHYMYTQALCHKAQSNLQAFIKRCIEYSASAQGLYIVPLYWDDVMYQVGVTMLCHLMIVI